MWAKEETNGDLCYMQYYIQLAHFLLSVFIELHNCERNDMMRSKINLRTF